MLESVIPILIPLIIGAIAGGLAVGTGAALATPDIVPGQPDPRGTPTAQAIGAITLLVVVGTVAFIGFRFFRRGS